MEEQRSPVIAMVPRAHAAGHNTTRSCCGEANAAPRSCKERVNEIAASMLRSASRHQLARKPTSVCLISSAAVPRAHCRAPI